MIEMPGLRRISAVVHAVARLRPCGRRRCLGEALRDRERNALEGADASLLGADDGTARGRNCIGQHALLSCLFAQARRLPRSAMSTLWVSRAVDAATPEITQQQATKVA